MMYAGLALAAGPIRAVSDVEMSSVSSLPGNNTGGLLSELLEQ